MKVAFNEFMQKIISYKLTELIESLIKGGGD